MKNAMPTHDKLNKVDFQWFIVRTLPHQEKKLAGMLETYKEQAENILEVYCPTHTTVNVRSEGKEEPTPLFAGFVFVLATQQAVSNFISKHYSEGTILYECRKGQDRKANLLTIPEEQMRLFKDFNENYAEQLVILERPYSDYAFNAKTGEPNEIVRVVDGPLAGREGYIARFRRDKRLVFNMKALEKDTYYTVSIPNIWNFHVVRLHNAEGDRQTTGTVKERATDLLVGLLQGCGHTENTLDMLYRITDTLAAKPSLSALRDTLCRKGQKELGQKIAALGTKEAGLLLDLARYEHDNPGYVRNHWNRLVLRPFLTPTAGTEMEDGQEEITLRHKDFTEIIRKVNITEQTYYPSKGQSELLTTVYYAHIGVMPSPQEAQEAPFILFANWDTFLGEYFHTAGKANERLVKGYTQMARDTTASDKKEKLIESFRNYAPTLYKVLADEGSAVKVFPSFKVGGETLHAMVLTAADMENGKDILIKTCTDICKEINATTHLAIWRRYLRTVWLHQ